MSVGIGLSGCGTGGGGALLLVENAVAVRTPAKLFAPDESVGHAVVLRDVA